MMQNLFRRRGPAPARGPRARRPALEALEERWVPADASQVFALPPGTTIFDLNSAIIRGAEALRTQVHTAVAADEQHTLNQLQQNPGGVPVNTQVSLGVTVIVGSNGTTLTGPASENINVFQGGTPVSSTNSTSGSISGSLKAANGTAGSGQFTFTLPDPNTGQPQT